MALNNEPAQAPKIIGADPQADVPQFHRQHDAFISYSRKNEDFAAKLEEALENYKPPRDLPVSKHRLDIFRDASDFRGGEYYQILTKHLKESAKLIVICSPEARESSWVEEEIELFESLRGRQHIIPVLFSGLPNHEASSDQIKLMAFPAALCKALKMPLGIDYRGFEERRDKLTRGKFAGSWYQLVSSIYEVSRDKVEQRERKREARTRRLIYGGFTAGIIILSVLSFFIWLSRNEAKRQQGIAEQQLRVAQQLLYVSDLTLAQQMQQSGNMKRAHELLEKYLTQESHLRGFEWYFLMTQYHNEVATLQGHTHEVTAVAISPDGKTLATSSRDATIKLWDVASRSKLFTLDDDYVFGISFSSEGKTLASFAYAGVDFKVKLWDLASRQKVGEFVGGHGKGVFAWAFSPDGKLLATSGNDFTVRVWDLALRRELFTTKPHLSDLQAVAFSPDGKILAAGNNNSIRLWDIASRRELAELRSEDEYAVVNAMAFSPDGKTLAIGARDTGVIWTLASRKRLTLKGHQKWIRAVAFSPHGNLIATSSEDNTIRVWEVKSGNEVAILRGHSGAVKGIVFPDETTLASVGGTVVKLWDQASWEPPHLPISAMIHALAFSPDGELLASGSYSQATVWKASSGKMFASLHEHTSQVNAVAFSPDSKTMAIGSHDRTVKLWDVESKKIEDTLSFPQEISSVGFSPDGKAFAVGTAYGSVKLFDTASRKELVTFSGHSGRVTGVAFLRDGNTLATSSEDSKVKLWEIASGSELAPIEGHNGGATALALSPDGKTLASGSGDGLVRLWDVASRKQLGLLSGHQERINGIAFSPDGLTLATASLDDTVKLWSLTSQSEVVTVRIHLYNTSAVAFSPDGKTLVAGGALGTEARVWQVLSEEEIKKRLYGY